MVKIAQDKSPSCNMLISSSELILWEAAKLSLNVKNCFNPARGLRFSWDNGREDGQRILARLDRFYVHVDPSTNLPISIRSYTIRSNCIISDHLPVHISLNLEELVKQKLQWKMNVRYLEETSKKV